MRNVLLVALAAVLLAACGGGSRDLATSIREASSAVGAARLALEAEADGDVWTSYTATMLTEAGTRLAAAGARADAAAVSTPEEARLRDDVVDTLSDAADALRAARDTADGVPGAPDRATTRRALAAAAEALDRWAERAGPPR